MTTIGFIGLGVMGRPMARNLIKAGHDLVVYNRSRKAVDELVADGARPADSAAETADAAEVVMTMLPDSPDVEQVVLADDGVLDHLREGALLVDLSSIQPSTAIAVAEGASEKGIRALDAPVSGGEQGAKDGSLSIMVGGSADAFDEARPLFDVLGKTVVHVGPPGAGQTVKLANQILVAGIIELVSEAIVLLEASNVDMEPALRVLAGGLAGNRILDTKATGMLARKFDPGFRVDLHHKDLRNALSVAAELPVALPVTALVDQLLVALRATSRGNLDHTALLAVVEELSGRRS